VAGALIEAMPSAERAAPRVRLDELVAAHAAALYPGLRDPRLHAYTDDRPPESVERLKARYRRLESRHSPRGDEQWLNWAVWHVDDGAYVGCVQATVGADGVAHVAYVLFADVWGRGLATEAVAAMMAVLFVHD
jgi:ribosomal-protein-alanine N-acetyltransferase